MRQLILILVYVFGLQENASAVPAITFKNGSWIGNGGLLVQCPGMASPALLDLIEEDTNTSELIFPAGTTMDKLAAFIARVARFSPERAALYNELAANFINKTSFVESVSDTSDTGSVRVPVGCTTMQAAMQYSFNPAEGNFYFIDATLWSQLTENMRAALILHEIIYFEASLIGHLGNSSYVRRYVRAIVEDRFKDMDDDQHFEFLSSLHLAVKFWKDPQSQKQWMLTSRVNRHLGAARLGCDSFKGFKLPSQQEFKEAAPRVFTSQAARDLALDDSDLGFWVVRDDLKFFSIMDYQGTEVGRASDIFFEMSGVGLCISK